MTAIICNNAAQSRQESYLSFADAPEHLQPFWDDFFLELRHALEQLWMAWKGVDFKTLASLAHCYKGQAMLFQYGGFYQRLEQLERYMMGKNQSQPLIEQALNELQQYFEQEVQRYEVYKNYYR